MKPLFIVCCPNIEKHLGKDRLEKEIKNLEKMRVVDESKRDLAFDLGIGVIHMVDRLIKSSEKAIDFQKWTKEAKESKDLKDCLFELSCISELSKHNTVTIKKRRENKVPDAYIESEGIYFEMTNLENVPQSIELKINDLCEKSEDRFGEDKGIHMVGINGFYEYSKEQDKMIEKEELSKFIEDLKRKTQNLSKNVLCFILVHNYINFNPKTEKLTWNQTPPYIICNGNADIPLLERVWGKLNIIKKEDLAKE